MFVPRMMLCGAVLVMCLNMMITSTATAQKTSSAAPPPIKEFRLQASYRSGIAQSYEVTEKTSVQRVHSDSSVRSYQREVLTYVTVRCVESMDNVSRVVVTADSVIYKFVTGPSVIDYDSQKDLAPKAFPDLNNYVGVLNRSFELTYSPYGEVTKVAGDQIDFWREYIQTNVGDLDTLISTIWLQSLSDENLLQLGDVQKQIVPGTKKAFDSSWIHNLRLRVDGVVYEGKARSTFKSYDGGVFTIATSDTLPARTRWPLHVFEIPDLVQMQEGQAVVSSTLQLSTNGTLNLLDATIAATFRGQVGKEIFTQNINSTQSWKLVRQYQW